MIKQKQSTPKSKTSVPLKQSVPTDGGFMRTVPKIRIPAKNFNDWRSKFKNKRLV